MSSLKPTNPRTITVRLSQGPRRHRKAWHVRKVSRDLFAIRKTLTLACDSLAALHEGETPGNAWIN